MFSNPELGCHPIGDPTSYLCQIVLSSAIPKTSTRGLPHEVAAMAALLGLRAVAAYHECECRTMYQSMKITLKAKSRRAIAVLREEIILLDNMR
jgi:hypothetical protein